ncbi:hypothetical protein, partial [Azospirillum sp. B506]|uniref:hypothetical protein n=1 Tax=Azospirillum sp. B506 TaxID=137721 RepID=UPI001B3B5882
NIIWSDQFVLLRIAFLSKGLWKAQVSQEWNIWNAMERFPTGCSVFHMRARKPQAPSPAMEEGACGGGNEKKGRSRNAKSLRCATPPKAAKPLRLNGPAGD